MQVQNRGNIGMGFKGTKLFEQATSRIAGNGAIVCLFPLAITLLLLPVIPGIHRRWFVCAAAPGLGREPRAKALLLFAERDIERIGLQALHQVETGRVCGIKDLVRNQATQTAKGSINS